MARSSAFTRPWKAAVALAVLWIGLFADWNWLWGVFFLAWGVQAFRLGTVFLVEEVDREKSPKLYWLITISWWIFGLLMIAVDIFPSLELSYEK